MQITNFIKGGNLLTLLIISLFLLLSVNPVSAGVIENRNFILNYDGWGAQTGGTGSVVASVTWAEINSTTHEGHVDFETSSAFTGPVFANLYQSINVTGINEITYQGKSGDWFRNDDGIGGGDSFEMTIGGLTQASPVNSTWDTYSLDVSSLSGVHLLKFELYTHITAQGTMHGDYFIKNVRTDADVDSPDYNDVLWNKDPYYTGETANITTNILDFDDGTYSYYLDLYNTDEYLTTYEITSETESNYYTFPTDWADTSLLAKLQRVTNPYGANEVNLAMDLSHFETLNWYTTVSFDKSSYDPGETLTVTWSGAPSGSTVWLRAMDDGEKIKTDVAYSDSFQFTVPTGTEETYYLVDVVINGVSQAQSSCDINIGDYWTTDSIYIVDYFMNVTGENQYTATVDVNTHIKTTIETNINVDFIDVLYFTSEEGQTISTTHIPEIDGNIVNVTFPNANNGEFYAVVKLHNISTASETRTLFDFNVGTASRKIDIYNAVVTLDDTHETVETGSVVGYGGNDLVLPLNRIVYFDIYADEIINSTTITSDFIYEGGSNYNFTHEHHLRRSYNFENVGLHILEFEVHNDETATKDFIKYNCYVQGVDQSLLDGNVVMYWTKSKIDLDEHVFLYYNVSNMPVGPVLTISTSDGKYVTEISMPSNHTSTFTIPDYYKIVEVYTATMTCDGVVYATSTLTITDPDAETAVDEVAEDEIFADKVTAMLNSDAFVALLVIISCVAVFGRTLGPVGAILGASVGTSMSYLMELIPVWIVFVMALALSVVFASKLIEKFGGGP